MNVNRIGEAFAGHAVGGFALSLGHFECPLKCRVLSALHSGRPSGSPWQSLPPSRQSPKRCSTERTQLVQASTFVLRVLTGAESFASSASLVRRNFLNASIFFACVI